jgi:predicted NAD/FAD-binding protein
MELASAPFGAADEVDAALAAWKANAPLRFEAAAAKVTFLMNALQQIGAMHALLNALEQAAGDG